MKNMNLLTIMEQDLHFENKLKSKEFVFTAETSPPDSTVRSEITDRVLCLKDLADAINVTDGASAKSHLSSLVVSSIIKDIEIDKIKEIKINLEK